MPLSVQGVPGLLSLREFTRRRASMPALVLLCALLAGANVLAGAPAQAETLRTDEVRTVAVIVRAANSSIARRAVEAHGGRVTMELPIVDGVAAEVLEGQLAALAAYTDVSPNSAITFQHFGHRRKCAQFRNKKRFRRCKRRVHRNAGSTDGGSETGGSEDGTGTGGSGEEPGTEEPGTGTDEPGTGEPGTGTEEPAPPAANAPQRIQRVVKATNLWEDGVKGRGVTVAVLDTGIYAAHPDLAGRVKACVDFSGESTTGSAVVIPAAELSGDIAGGLPNPGNVIDDATTDLPDLPVPLPSPTESTPLPSLSPTPLPVLTPLPSAEPLPTLDPTPVSTPLPSLSPEVLPSPTPTSEILPSPSLSVEPLPSPSISVGLVRSAGAQIVEPGLPDGCDDTFGHGTFMAGLIAGDGSVSDGKYSGAAPKASLVGIKASGFDGSTDISKILAGIQWAVAHKDVYDIGVLNLSLGSDSAQDYRLSPLNFAVEKAWQAGIVVVVSSGNSGPEMGTVMKPGDDPFVVTVGSSNDEGTFNIADDRVPVFSSRGTTRSNGLMKPDVVSPGVRTVGLRSPGSAIDQAYGDHAVVDNAYFRGSGTSMSTATVSGIAALILQKNPNLTPDQVKHRLLSTSRAIADTDPRLAGRGLVDAYAAATSTSTKAANQGIEPATGLGSLEADRGTVQTDVVTPLGQVSLTGDYVAQTDYTQGGDFLGLVPWVSATYATSGWDASSWKASSWKTEDWAASSWKASSWKATHWDASSWKGTDWDNPDWDASSWKASSWKNFDWDASSWKASSWKSAWYGVAWD